MKFRGLDPSTRLARWGLTAIAVGIVLGAMVPSLLHDLAIAWSANRDILPWVVERLFGFVAYIAVAASMIYGLLLSTKILDAIAHRPITFALHQDLAAIGLALAAVHGILLTLDRTVPFSLAQVAIPGLAPVAPLGVGVGQVGLYLMAIVVASFYVRRGIGQRAWRTLHYLTFIAFVMATLHGVLAGSDTTAPWAMALYVVSTVAVTGLLAIRIRQAAERRTPRPVTDRPLLEAVLAARALPD